MDIGNLALFTVTFGAVLAMPGPNAAFAMAQSLRFGFRASLAIPAGFATATALHAAFVFSGLGLIIRQYTVLLSAFKWIGVVYLLWLAYKAFQAKPSAVQVAPKAISKIRLYISTIFVSLTNPKAILASVMIYPLFVSDQYSYLPQALMLSTIAGAISGAVYGSYSLVASMLKKRITAGRSSSKILGGMYLSAATLLAVKST